MIKNTLILKKIFIIIVLLITIILPSNILADQQNNTYCIQLSDGNIHLQSIAIAAYENSIHVVWVNNYWNTSEICYIKSEDCGETWNDVKKLTKNDHIVENQAIGVYKKNVHAIWKDYRSGIPEIYYRKSVDMGENWQPEQQLTFNHSRIHDIYDLKTCVYEDNIHIVWKDYRHGGAEIYYKNSINNGETWERNHRLTYDYSPSYEPSITVVERQIFLVWENWDKTSEIAFMMSQDAGKTWSNTIPITTNGESEKPWITTFNNTIHIVWKNNRDGRWNIHYIQSMDEGKSLTKSQKLTSNKFEVLSPQIIDTYNSLFIIWQEKREDNYIVKCKKSENNGITWLEEMVLIKNSDYPCETAIGTSGSIIYLFYNFFNENECLYYKKIKEDRPIISSTTISSNILLPGDILNLTITGYDISYSNIELICIVQYESPSGEYHSLKPTFTSNHWVCRFSYRRNLDPGVYSFKTKLINPNGSESIWILFSESIVINPPPLETPNIGFFYIVKAILINLTLYFYYRKK